MPTSSSIKAALVTAVKSITTANGYVTNLAPANVLDHLASLDNLQQVDASSYPRVFIISDGADYTDLPSNRIQKEEKFTVLAIFAPNTANAEDTPMDTQVANFVDDFETMIARNKQLGGSDVVEITTLATDAQTPATEAAAMFELSITYRRSLQ